MTPTVDQRAEYFSKEVFETGGTIYTKEMLNRFIEHWTEPDRARKPKMKFEKEKTWRTAGRLARWSRNNYDNIVCFLTESEKTIAEKRKTFADQLRPFVGIYNRSVLNEFYRFYAMPENKPIPVYLRWETIEFWDTSTKLAEWGAREAKRKAKDGPTKY